MLLFSTTCQVALNPLPKISQTWTRLHQTLLNTTVHASSTKRSKRGYSPTLGKKLVTKVSKYNQYDSNKDWLPTYYDSEVEIVESRSSSRTDKNAPVQCHNIFQFKHLLKTVEQYYFKYSHQQEMFTGISPPLVQLFDSEYP